MKVRPLLAIALLASSLAVGCHLPSRNPPSTTTLQVSMDDVLQHGVIAQKITLTVGQTLVVKLGSNYTTPYRWNPQIQIADQSVLTQESHEFEQPASDALGAPGTEVWRFSVRTPGTTTLTTAYASIVGQDPKPTCTYFATVTVQSE